ncbi:molybdopterin oxidoreductase family protein [Lichenihabitans sp. Uapishka_5]|uniref:molybdopterin-containing oxidoreductase family protein n=1 Tax=Lichenihabitans sp. Uapishka_5 TaxID=3037302 RepID=UPI0029E824AB|nr:molybdopterin oxidoreductase family protein [Lichenihabitans sp. Uapishka_5]MDX7953581.1 molybdopterin oxidoreductase family protein [Lichenihabitans sp. Uapishka_5]
MNAPLRPQIRASACPHDCPSCCALEIEVEDGRIGRVRGAAANSYTAGVICAKVARYAERVHNPDRLTVPLRRVGPKGSGRFAPVSWDEALDETASRFLEAERRYGPETVWPYFYAGTMGLVMRDGINRLRHAKGYSDQYSTICTALSWAGWMAGHGRLTGTDPREIPETDCVVLWGTNAVVTQVNVMAHAVKARKGRGAPIVAVDVYDNPTMQQADVKLLVRPGTDGALACGVMHALFRDGHADRAYMARYADDPAGLEAHLATRTPAWASSICGVPEAEIEAFAALLGARPRAFFRVGYGFARQRNGAAAMHAVSSIPVVLGSWQHRGGGALHSNSGMFKWDKTLIEGLDRRDPGVRRLDQSRIGAVLNGDPAALAGGPPVTALFIQNTNPVTVAPDQSAVRRGFLRDDLFTVVHEQVMTDTARLADLVLPATMFVEHDDLYQGGGHQHILLGPKLIEPPGECRSNHAVISALAARLGADHRGFGMTARALIDETLQASGRGTLADLERDRWIDCQQPFTQAHFLDGFGHADGRFHFRADWSASSGMPSGPVADMPVFPDHWAVTEAADAAHPFRLATSPARNFLNSSFTETPSSLGKEDRPSVLIHPEDAAAATIAEGDVVTLANPRGSVRLHAKLFAGLRRGVLVAESIWPNDRYLDGAGINTLTGADAPAPVGGAAVHDIKVALRVG